MNISDKKFIEFSEQVWERNKELLAEKRELLNEVKRLKADLEEVNARCSHVMDEQYKHICELEEEVHDLTLANDCLSDMIDDLQSRIDEAVDILDDDDNIVEDCFIDDIPDKIGKVIEVKEEKNGLTITVNVDNIC